jgi:small multidrug resistance family-3 protein
MLIKTVLLYGVTALAEIVGCYLPYLVLKQGKSAWLLIPAVLALGLFAWLLTLHPAASGRVYAAYGGVYIAVALLWLWLVDGITPSTWGGIGTRGHGSDCACTALGCSMITHLVQAF